MTASRVPLGVLDELEAALAGSKPGPWRVSENAEDVVSPTHGVVADAYVPADAALIVAAVNAVPGLLAAVRAVADVVERMRNHADVQPWREDLRAALSSALGAEGAGGAVAHQHTWTVCEIEGQSWEQCNTCGETR